MPHTEHRALDGDDDGNEVFDGDADVEDFLDPASFDNRMSEVNAAAGSLVPPPPKREGAHPRRIVVQPPFPPEPELARLSPEAVVRRVIGEFRSGDVIQIGSATRKGKVHSYTALAVSSDVSDTVRQLMMVFSAIAAQDSVPYWKLNAYDRRLVEDHSGVRFKESWDGGRLTLKTGTWSDDHVARIAFLSGDHDVGRDANDAMTRENALPYDEALARYWWKIQTMMAAPMLTMLQFSGRGFSPIWQLDPPVVSPPRRKRRCSRSSASFSNGRASPLTSSRIKA